MLIFRFLLGRIIMNTILAGVTIHQRRQALYKTAEGSGL